MAVKIESFIEIPGFPCVGAKTAHAKGQLATVAARDLRCPADDPAILEAVYEFLASYRATREMFQSLIVEFAGPTTLDEAAFEQALWARLQALHTLDAPAYTWDESVSRNPDDPKFSLSLGGKAFYVVGLHPGSSRKARRFSRPALVFNLHEQFERLRETGAYQQMQKLIRRRDRAYSGSENPMLSDFGRRSEARQYSGRVVDPDWVCPFRALDS